MHIAHNTADVPQGSLQHDEVGKFVNDARMCSEGIGSRQQHRDQPNHAEEPVAENTNSDDDIEVIGEYDVAADETTWDPEFRSNPCEDIRMTAEEIRQQDADLGIGPSWYRNAEAPYSHLVAAADDNGKHEPISEHFCA